MQLAKQNDTRGKLAAATRSYASTRPRPGVDANDAGQERSAERAPAPSDRARRIEHVRDAAIAQHERPR
jgi:hypothetical protein